MTYQRQSMSSKVAFCRQWHVRVMSNFQRIAAEKSEYVRWMRM